MELFLRYYLEHFNDLPRNSLHDRRKRKSMVEYISILIEACSAGKGNEHDEIYKYFQAQDYKVPRLNRRGVRDSSTIVQKSCLTGLIEDDSEESCRVAIRVLLHYHEEMKNTNGTVCLMGKYHNILYVAVKLCYIWQLKDADTVSALLEQIYFCEKTFERILIGALFGHKAPHYIAGWKSDFDSQEENLRAVVYFLDKANKSFLKLPFICGDENRLYRFIDLPIESCGKSSPLKIAVELGLPDKLLIFLRFGAEVYTHARVDVFEHILKRLSGFNHVYPYNLVSCLQLLLRVVPRIKLNLHDEYFEDLYTTFRERVFVTYSDLIEDGILPLSSCGLRAPKLKHLCRCIIRQRLWVNYQLPDGIRKLCLPESLWRYLDVLED
ncbi:hypothetical protein NQ317_018496 [Molorchus minor]|uniref:SOCS box domain-containing protein n=1 Tax=Molorchus minor TaxID=1323400 RepID=A0ABQ9JWV1_9CUCU|nr:hypothetical protein NQ317_018496 [Molorchus minor]